MHQVTEHQRLTNSRGAYIPVSSDCCKGELDQIHPSEPASYTVLRGACFKKNSPLHISTKIFPSRVFIPKNHKKFSFHPAKILMKTFLVIVHKLWHFCYFSSNFPPHHPIFTYQLLSLPFISSKFINSLQKQPFITAYFRSSLHILRITAR